MIEAIFWLVIGLLFLGSVIMWWEERKVRRGERNLIEEVTAYLTKRKGAGE